MTDGAERTDTIVLACTHFPLLLDRFERLAPWPVRWIDPAPAIARRVVELVGPKPKDRHREGLRDLHLGRSPNPQPGLRGLRADVSGVRHRAATPRPRRRDRVLLTGALHQVTPVTRGKRYAFIPFFYGEEEATARLANNALLADGETHYTGERDRLLSEHRARRCPGEPEGEPTVAARSVALFDRPLAVAA